MVSYPLKHLTQAENQEVWGPIQDDEALLLFGLIRVMRLKRILEIGGLSGYSATNFLAAAGEGASVYTIDINPVAKVGPTHITIQKNASDIMPADLDHKSLDMVFFDCHVYQAQMAAFLRLRAANIVCDRTVLAWHDTNLHPKKFSPIGTQVYGGWAHQPEERQMVNEIRRMGYDVISFHTEADAHGPELQFRHGLTIARLFKPLVI